MTIIAAGVLLMVGAMLSFGTGWVAGIRAGQMGPMAAALLAGLAIAAPGALVGLARMKRNKPLLFTGLAVYPFCFGMICPAIAAVLAHTRPFTGLGGRSFILSGLVLTILGWGVQVLILRMALPERGSAPTTRAVAIDRQALFLIDEYASWMCSLVALVVALPAFSPLLASIPLPVWSAGVVVTSLLVGQLGAILTTSLLRRWSVPVPREICDLVDRMAELTGVRFQGVAYFDDTFTSTPLMEVRLGWSGHLLLFNERALRSLAPEERLALLAHETAHVRNHHVVKELMCAAVLSWIILLLVVSIAGVLFASSAIVALNVVIALSLVNMACRNALRRRWERHADAYAARVAGAAALASALTKLLPPGPGPLWGTHDGLDARLRRLEQAGV